LLSVIAILLQEGFLYQSIIRLWFTFYSGINSEVGHDLNPMRNAILSELSKAAQLPLAVGDKFQLLDDSVNTALARILFDGADVKTLDNLAIELDYKLNYLESVS
jgi:hypothetical protein